LTLVLQNKDAVPHKIKQTSIIKGVTRKPQPTSSIKVDGLSWWWAQVKAIMSHYG